MKIELGEEKVIWRGAEGKRFVTGNVVWIREIWDSNGLI